MKICHVRFDYVKRNGRRTRHSPSGMVPRAAWCKTGWNNLGSSPWREGELWLGTGLQVIPCLETTLVLAGRSPEVGALVGGGAIVVRLREETAAGIFWPEFAAGNFLPGDRGANP
ncbi:hypothetical protein Adt_28697 [Abeliophyllum distichum]|uniref:Uncharacterized protein n=1 Tax=Abeliophyllum distichum TaxID=126358 RepID=A0ABD1RXB2_9LAMI